MMEYKRNPYNSNLYDFNNNPYASPTVDTTPPQKYKDKYRGKIVGAGVTLIVVGVLQGIVGTIGAFSAFNPPIPPIIWVPTLFEGCVNIIMGILTLRDSYRAAFIGLVLSILNLAVSIQLSIFYIAFKGIIVFFVGRGTLSLLKINTLKEVSREELYDIEGQDIQKSGDMK